MTADLLDYLEKSNEKLSKLQTLPANPGLWLDRAAPSKADDIEEQRHALFSQICRALELNNPKATAIPVYKVLYDQWASEATRKDSALSHLNTVFEATSRIWLHPMSGATINESGLLLHPVYGVPFLPGTALKGLARQRLKKLLDTKSPLGIKGLDYPSGQGDAAEEELNKFKANVVRDIFGIGDPADEAIASVFDFWDALWIPEMPERSSERTFSPLALDVVTPHHSEYYEASATSSENKEPDDFSVPVPVQGISIRPGARFLIRIEARHHSKMDDWLRWILKMLLAPSLEVDGIGAKTRAGYGRLRRVDSRASDKSNHRQQATSSYQAPQEIVAEVSYQKNTRSFFVQLADGLEASAQATEAERIAKELPEDTMMKFKKKKARPLKLRVQIQSDQGLLKIISLKPI